MEKKEIKIFNNSLILLRKMDFLKVNDVILNEYINKDTIKDYFIYKYLNKLNDEDQRKVISSIREYDDEFEPGVVGTRSNFRTFVPKIKSVNDALIYIHELTHAISLLNGNENYITDEVLPTENERKFLYEFDINFDIIKNKLNKSILACKTYEEYENIKHIYASLLLSLYNKIDESMLYSKNQLVEFINKGYTLDKRIYKKLK